MTTWALRMERINSSCVGKIISMARTSTQTDGHYPLIVIIKALLPLYQRTLISSKVNSFLKWSIRMDRKKMSRRSRKDLMMDTMKQIGRFFLLLRKAP